MNVEFNEEAGAPVRANRPRPLSVFTRLVYKLKLAKSEEGAQRVILIAAIATFVIAIWLVLGLV